MGKPCLSSDLSADRSFDKCLATSAAAAAVVMEMAVVVVPLLLLLLLLLLVLLVVVVVVVLLYVNSAACRRHVLCFGLSHVGDMFVSLVAAMSLTRHQQRRR